MKKIFLFIFFIISVSLFCQSKNELPFNVGEWIQFRVHYSFLNASFVTLELKEATLRGKSVFRAVSEAKTTGFASLFFKVRDYHESYFDIEDGKPYRFTRNIYEGGFTKDIEIDYYHNRKQAITHNNENGENKIYDINEKIHDFLSAFYFVRNTFNPNDLIVGKDIELTALFDDDKPYNFKLKYLGIQTIRSRFGKIECATYRPFVESGRVFKENESLTIWISNDENRLPIRIEANLKIGKLRGDLFNYRNIKSTLKTKKKLK